MLRALIAIILICFAAPARADLDTGDMTTADKCKALRQLSSMYRGASLSLAEKAIKAQLIAWYRANCRGRR